MPKFKTKEVEEVEESEERTLEQITTDLGESYEVWKEGEKLKDSYKDEFFEAVTASIDTSDLAKKTINVSLEEEDEAREWIKARHPLFSIDSMQKTDEGYRAILTENPELKSYVFVNPKDKKVYQRSVSEGSPYLDDNAVRAKDPDLWLEISDVPMRAIFGEMLYESGVDHTEVNDRIDALFPAHHRALKPLGQLSDEQMAAIQEYLIYTKPRITFPAVRKAKPDELPDG